MTFPTLKARTGLLYTRNEMKDLSFFLFKNFLGGKMRKGISNFCNGDGSTSTLNQQHHPSNNNHDDDAIYNQTLEQMILQLELEEEIARKSKLEELSLRGRMSCVNNSDILRSARNALNQYPRFSLDGKDAMYRSSFRSFDQVAGRKSVCCDRGVLVRERMDPRNDNYYLDPKIVGRRKPRKPTSFGGENVVWCKPGVIAKLMGLDAMPVPLNSSRSESSIPKRKNLRRRVERHEMERRDMHLRDHNINRGMRMASSASSSSSKIITTRDEGYGMMKPISLEPLVNDQRGWPTR